MLARGFLALVGLLYLGLAAWCSLSPGVTSQKVGFTLQEDSGRSEFLTVYGGLEFGLGLIFLWPLMRQDATAFSLLACLLVHASLVAFRSASLLLYRDFGPTTARLAVGEWAILIGAAILWRMVNAHRGP